VRAEYQVHRTFIPQVEQGPLKLSARPADVGHDWCQGILAMAVISRYELFQIPQYQNLALFRGNSAKHFSRVHFSLPAAARSPGWESACRRCAVLRTKAVFLSEAPFGRTRSCSYCV
jgi:hypothetical protein